MRAPLALAVLALCGAQALAAPNEVERGRYLATVGDCMSCHTVKCGKPFAGGLPIDTGFGIVYTPNITPDKATGIGNWSDDDFYRALHTGIDDEGHHLYPAFPYPWFTRVTRDDVLAIKAYLETVPPVHQANKPAQLEGWLGWRPLMAGWNAINFDAGEYRPDRSKSAQWNRGAYLVEGLGHCGDCHTAKKSFGGPITREKLQGGFWDGWAAPNLAGDERDGLGRWSRAEVVEFLKTGSNAKSAAVGRMAEVVAHSTSHFSDADLQAVATYLKDLPARTHDVRDTPPLDRAGYARGEELYVDNCAACHMQDGRGMPGAYPPLALNPLLQGKDAGTATRVVLGGARMVATKDKPTGLAMPAFGAKLDDREVADLVNYVRNAWGNRAPLTDDAAVAKLRKAFGVHEPQARREASR
ncbi:MAG: c-type cytochrome [Betaproteobacteria bacterium]